MKIYIFILGLAGLGFAGYLSGVKLFTETCAFGESCPYFLGYPACYFGFVMYALISLFAGLYVFARLAGKTALNAVMVVALMGILFAGYFTVQELPLLFKEGFSAYFFGLPTCALGLIFYVVIFVFTLIEKGRQNR